MKPQIENIEKILSQQPINNNKLQELESNILNIKDDITNNGWEIQLGNKIIKGYDCTRIIVQMNYLLLITKFNPLKLPNNIKNIFAI